MADQVLINIPIWVGGYDFTPDVNELSLDAEAEVKEKTNFASGGWQEYVAGLKMVKAGVKGFLDTSVTEPALQAYQGVAGVPLSAVVGSGAGNVGAVAGDTAHFSRFTVLTFAMGGKVGDVAPISGDLQSTGPTPFVVGKVLSPITALAVGTTNGTAVQAGAISSVQVGYAAAHFTAQAGTSPALALKIQSAPLSNFASPTDRITFTSVTSTPSYQTGQVAGAITDTWWRIVGTITGSSFPTITAAVVFGIA